VQREHAFREQRDQPLRAEVRREVGHRPVVAGGGEGPDDDVAEAGGAQQPGEAPPDEPVAAPAGLGRGNLGVHRRGVGEERLGQAPQGRVHLDHGQQPAGPQHAQRLGEYRFRRGHVLCYVPQQHPAGGPAAQRQPGRVADDERAAAAARVAEQLLVDVDADHRQPGQRPPKQPGHRAAARAELEQRRRACDAEVAQYPQLLVERQLRLGRQPGDLARESARRGGGGIVGTRPRQARGCAHPRGSIPRG